MRDPTNIGRRTFATKPSPWSSNQRAAVTPSRSMNRQFVSATLITSAGAYWNSPYAASSSAGASARMRLHPAARRHHDAARAHAAQPSAERVGDAHVILRRRVLDL